MWSRILLSALRKKKPIHNKQQKKARLLVEALESRELLSGDLLVSLVGTGATLASTGTATFIQDYTNTGTLVSANTITLPTTGTSAFTEGGTTTTEGYLTDSADGHSVSIAGYLVAAGTSTSSAVRAIGVIGPGGTFNSTTQMPSATGSVRVAVSADGLGFWVATSTGVRYVPFGNAATAASTLISSEATSPTAVGISVDGTSSGQLFASAGAGAQSNGVPALDSPFTVGSGLPTNAGQTIAVSPSFPTARDAFNNFPTTNQFVISPDGNTIYIADGRTDTKGGILKYLPRQPRTNGLCSTVLQIDATADGGLRGSWLPISAIPPALFFTPPPPLPPRTGIVQARGQRRPQRHRRRLHDDGPRHRTDERGLPRRCPRPDGSRNDRQHYDFGGHQFARFFWRRSHSHGDRHYRSDRMGQLPASRRGNRRRSDCQRHGYSEHCREPGSQEPSMSSLSTPATPPLQPALPPVSRSRLPRHLPPSL